MTRHTLARTAAAPDLPTAAVAPPAAARPIACAPAPLPSALLDRLLARWSEVPDEPVLDMRLFPWTATLRAEWRTIRDEAAAVAPQVGRWRAFPLWRAGVRVDANAARCPATAALLGGVPGIESATISILAPGVHEAERRGPTKALVTCHLGLAAPRDGDVRMRLGARTLRWAEGETLVFDDTRPHTVWNDAAAPRVVLLIRFRRPLRRPGAWLGEVVVRMLRRAERRRKGFAAHA